ncbi:DUF397 domain-containing protein [Actinomadura adrarensis]|uniref:DUF397 domain-containing protein n=1 Tax=Actinomadura adrarensis TaxID=1819600 RepID=A0ABW3CBL9_9ACTN
MGERAAAAVCVPLAWRKSSHSGADSSHCVEVAAAGPVVAARDSKAPHGPTLYLTEGAWADLLDRVRSGALDL